MTRIWPGLLDISRVVKPETNKPRHFRPFASQELIIVWLEVRVLPAPPRSLAQTEISRFIANCPELAGFRVCASSLQRAFES